MLLKELNQNAVSKHLSQQVYYVTCMECCKYYIAPETANCGHTLCHLCWSGRRTCPVCALPLNKKTLKLNNPLQSLAEHIHALSDAFERLFGVKLAEMELALDKENDPIKNVKEWLASSQNHFSAPVTSSQHSTQEPCNIKPVELSASKIQIHSRSASNPTNKVTLVENKTTFSKTIPSIPSQDDWDKIEVLPDSEEVANKNKEIVSSKDKQRPSICVDENAYSTDNPRRSSRNRENKNEIEEKFYDSGDKSSSKKTTQNWNNVKKMRKEFSKLNKKDKNKLNVSIEMCKKAQSTINKKDSGLVCVEALKKTISDEVLYEIEEQTPNEAPPSNHNSLNENDPQNKNVPDAPVAIDINNLEVAENEQMDTSIHKECNKNTSVDVNQLEMSKNQTNSNVTTVNIDPNIKKMVFMKKGNLHQDTLLSESNNIKITQQEINSSTVSMNTDDIEISIKVGNTVTNILIKKKSSDVQMKVNTDREIQTTLGPYTLPHKDAACSPIKACLTKVATQKTTETTKKNTASADTTSAHFEITESVEKELSLLMECEKTAPEVSKPKRFANFNKPVIEQLSATPLEPIVEDQTDSLLKNAMISQTKNKSVNKTEHSVLESTNKNLCKTQTLTEINKNLSQPLKKTEQLKRPAMSDLDKEIDDIDDVDMFSGSVKETLIQSLKNTEPMPSEVFMPTMKTGKTQHIEKRDRENDESEMPNKKKLKLDMEKVTCDENPQERDELKDSQNMNYDVIMSQVFASIDADIKSQKKALCKETANNSALKNNNIVANIEKNQSLYGNKQVKDDQKYSENVFSFLDKDNEPVEAVKINQIAGPETQAKIQKLLTPGMLRDLASANVDAEINDVEMQETPMMDADDDKSVVEETPQKNVSFTHLKQKTDISDKTAENARKPEEKNTQGLGKNDSQIIRSIINISDQTLPDSNKNNVSIVDNKPKESLKLETPVTINKFVNHIQHKSTPVARKSLNFDASEVVDNEQTLCPSITQDKPSQPMTLCPTTQEKEFLAKAFEQTPSPVKVPAKQKTPEISKTKKFCLAGSCLSVGELGNLKKLCAAYNWTFVDKYTKDLTHLIVGVDEENKSQRSVKFMCALAASKWIVSYSWVEMCLKTGIVVDEEPFEALDATGDPGPKLSRTSTRKLFEGFTFYCMSPFSILDVEYLKYMVEAAGGTVARTARDVKVTPGAPPAVLLAEPENTQEDKFIYLAMELSIVPVNYEWVLNSLGSYCLSSLYDLLLCPSTLLPPAVNTWPPELLMRDKDDE